MTVHREPLRILVTGSRGWTDNLAIAGGITRALSYLLDPALGHTQSRNPGPLMPSRRLFAAMQWHQFTLVHGDAPGADWAFARIAQAWGLTVEKHPARQHRTPLVRNQHMVNLGAAVCVAAALQWASGTGHCARLARTAGIHTIDIGVSTRVEDRP